jgi:hypothetical protein
MVARSLPKRGVMRKRKRRLQVCNEVCGRVVVGVGVVGGEKVGSHKQGQETKQDSEMPGREAVRPPRLDSSRRRDAPELKAKAVRCLPG